MGSHQHGTGDWLGAIQSLAVALQRFRAVGHLHNQSVTLTAQMLMLRSIGDPRWLQVVDDAVALATEAQDEQMIGWAKGSMGAHGFHRGDFASGATNFEESCAMLERVHDFQSLAHMLARLALCEAKLGKCELAIEHVKASEEVVKAHRVGPLFEARAVGPAAEAYLCAAELTPKRDLQNELLRCAKRSCNRLARIGHRFSDESVPEALRLQGIHAWLSGDQRYAETLWQRGVRVAEKKQAIHVLAKLHHEMGLRMNDAAQVRLAKELFVRTGALDP
jgi:hypothetical protein